MKVLLMVSDSIWSGSDHDEGPARVRKYMRVSLSCGDGSGFGDEEFCPQLEEFHSAHDMAAQAGRLARLEKALRLAVDSFYKAEASAGRLELAE